jgi:hypothetical protein
LLKAIRRLLEKHRPQKGYRYWIASNTWIFLIAALLVFWIMTWVLTDWASPRFNTMANIVSAVGIVALTTLTYIFSRYIKGLAESTKSQSQAIKAEVETIAAQAKSTIDLASATAETIKLYDEELKRMLRPLMVPDLVKSKTSRWDKWEGTFKIRNIGNGPAMQSVISVKTQAVTHIKMEPDELVFQKELMYMGIHDDPVEIVVTLKIPVAARSIVTQRPVKMAYVMEIYWDSLHEEGHARAVLPFTLGLDRSGDAKFNMQAMEIDWDARPEAESE